jgi:diguanylate cyclase
MTLDLSARSQARVVLTTVLGTAVTMVVALLCAWFITRLDGLEAYRETAVVMAVGLTLLLSVPCYYFFASKLRQLAIAHHELALVASRDSLTTCLNRGAFITLVDAYLSQVNAEPPLEGALLVVDADHFKAINDTYGHAAGDEALRQIASALQQSVRPTDLVGRVGGEEFAIFLPRVGAAQALALAERVRKAVASIQLKLDGRDLHAPISISVGAALFRGRIDFEDLFRVADGLLYKAKDSGRNRVVLSEAPLAA